MQRWISNGKPEGNTQVTWLLGVRGKCQKTSLLRSLLSACFPQPNGQAAVVVKTVKCLWISNTGLTDNLDYDQILHGMLQLPNTPKLDCNISLAQIIFGRFLQETLSFANLLEKFLNPHICQVWGRTWACSLYMDHSRYWVPEGALAISLTTNPWCQPNQLGQIRGHSKITGPWSIQGK